MSSTIDKKPASYYVGERYKEYLVTNHWRKLRKKYIFDDPTSRCWICEVPLLISMKYGQMLSNLLLHHVSYRYLFHERLYRDIYILCTNCHSRVHFSVYLRLFTYKTPLIRLRLYRKMILLKIRYCIQYGRYWSIPWYILRYLFS